MTRRRRREGAGAIVRELRAQGDRIITAIRETSAEQNASREAMGDEVLRKGAAFLRAALDEATPRAVVLDPPVANDAREPTMDAVLRVRREFERQELEREPAPTTPPSGPANDTDGPESPKGGGGAR